MAKRRSQAPAWANRIVSSGTMPAGQFLANPGNYRKHPTAQEQALIGILDRVGWVQSVVVNKRTGYVVDGHMRIKAAMARSEDEPVPYVVVDLTEAEEALILSTLDPISAMAITDKLALQELLQLIPDEMSGLAAAVHATKEEARQLVSFEAKVHHRVVVECADAEQQHALHERLVADGYHARMTGGEG
jgi:hypothetical protein